MILQRKEFFLLITSVLLLILSVLIIKFFFSAKKQDLEIISERWSELQQQEKLVKEEIIIKSNQGILYSFSNGILSWDVKKR